MIWQDIVLSIGQWIFVIALLPSVFGNDKPALSSSVLTGAVLAVFAFVYATLGLWSSVAAGSAISITWFILAWQQYRRKKKETSS
jgi:heme O synthase-like polyprenyltransferase